MDGIGIAQRLGHNLKPQNVKESSSGTARNGKALRKPRCTKKQLLERIAVALEEIATQLKIKNQARAADAHWRRDA